MFSNLVQISRSLEISYKERALFYWNC